MSSHELPPLPRGWVWSRVSEVGEVRLGRQRSPKDHVGKHMRPYLRVANVFEARIDTSDVLQMNFTPEEFEIYQLKPGDILLNEGQSLEWVGRPAIYRGEVPGACFQNTLVRFRAYPCVLPEFALLVFRMYLHSQRFQRIAKWTTNIAHLGSQRFAELEFPVPPLAEQKSIVAETETLLSDLDAGIAALKRVQNNLTRYRASVLKAACEGRLVPTEAELARIEDRDYESADKLLERILRERQEKWQADQLSRMKTMGKEPQNDTWKERYEAPAHADLSVLGTLPQGWTWATYEQVARRVTVGYVGSMKHEYVPEGIPFLRSQNVRVNRFDSRGLLFITPRFHAEIAKSTLKPGDIVVVRSGSVGVACVIPDSIREANCSDLVIIQEPLGLNPKYGAYYLNSLAKQAVRAGQVGVALTHFNTKSVAALTVAVPPMAEQQRIADEVERRLSVVDELEKNVDSKFRRAEHLRQAILKRAFEGRLVPQDPSDEPASALLERIRQQRASPPPGPSTLKQMTLRLEDPMKPRTPRRRSASS